MKIWYKSLAEAPNIGYPGSPDVERSKLSGYNAIPEHHSFEFDGKTLETLYWKIRGESTSASPARQLLIQPKEGESVAQTTLRQLHEALELPGELSDYHFAIQGCIDSLWKYRSEEPWVVAEIERLCRLSIRLALATPETVSYEKEGQTAFYRISAFGRLIYLYKREGYLFEALEVAKCAMKFDQEHAAYEELQERIRMLESEDAH